MHASRPTDERPDDRNLADARADQTPHTKTSAQSSDSASDQLDRRRASILSTAAEAGIATETAELMYDVALEEGLDPALALDLVKSGMAVEPPAEADIPDAPTADRYLPTWLFPASSREQLDRERLLRLSFRRLRGLVESEGDVEAAFQRFAAEPDVRRHGY